MGRPAPGATPPAPHDRWPSLGRPPTTARHPRPSPRPGWHCRLATKPRQLGPCASSVTTPIRLRLQIRENREYPPVIVGGTREAELAENAGDVLFDSALGDDELGGDGVVGAALGHQRKHLTFAWGEFVQRAG